MLVRSRGAAHFLSKAARRFGREGLRLRRADIEAMQHYPWPGNVRLENLMERAVILDRRASESICPGAASRAPIHPEPGASNRRHAGREETPWNSTDLAPRAPGNERERVALERRMIEQALAASGGKVSGPGGAAERLGLKPTTLASRIKRHGIGKRR